METQRKPLSIVSTQLNLIYSVHFLPFRVKFQALKRQNGCYFWVCTVRGRSKRSNLATFQLQCNLQETNNDKEIGNQSDASEASDQLGQVPARPWVPSHPKIPYSSRAYRFIDSQSVFTTRIACTRHVYNQIRPTRARPKQHTYVHRSLQT